MDVTLAVYIFSLVFQEALLSQKPLMPDDAQGAFPGYKPVRQL